MNIPKTYKEFLKTPKPEIQKIVSSKISLQEAQRMMKFFNQFDNDYLNKPIQESKNNSLTYGDDLNG